MSTSMCSTPVTVSVVDPMPSICHTERLQEEAQVLDHVVRRGVADDRGARVAGRRHEGVLGHRVPTLGEDDRRARGSGRHPRSPRRNHGWPPRRARRACRADRWGSMVRVPRSHPPAYGSWKLPSSCRSGPRNMMTVRVRRAASTSMLSRSMRAGGMISRSLLSGSHRTLTPIEVSTSMIRLTSSMRARLRRVVRPLLSSAGAQQGDGGVLARLDRDRAGELLAADDRAGAAAGRCARARRTRCRASRRCARASPGLRFWLALFDAGDCALARAEQVGELALGQALVAASVPDEGADAGEVRRQTGDGHQPIVDHM
jgi:hypothetical protein